ncbi:MAG TPA: hypothetical protein VNF71_14520 [Acidimicrobiales bacterium]|nr:hypothetical protein [Acidimicrobiales bacterium]
MERRSVLASALLAFMVLGGCTGATHALTGEVSFLGTPIGLDCLGNSTLAGSLPGVHDGSEVVVEDATHAVVGTAALIPLPGSGRKPGPTYFEGVGLCDFSFTVTDIPDSKFYSITIGGLPGPTYSSDQLQSMNWTVVLGNPPTDVAPVQSELPATQTPTPAATPQPVYGLNQAITLPGYSRIGPDPNDYTPTNFVTIDAAQLTVIAEETWKGKPGSTERCRLRARWRPRGDDRPRSGS